MALLGRGWCACAGGAARPAGCDHHPPGRLIDRRRLAVLPGLMMIGIRPRSESYPLWSGPARVSVIATITRLSRVMADR